MPRKLRIKSNRVTALEDAERAKNAEIIKAEATELILRAKDFDRLYGILSRAKKRHLLVDFERILFRSEGIVISREKPRMIRHNPVEKDDDDDVEVDGLHYRRVNPLDLALAVHHLRLNMSDFIVSDHLPILSALNRSNIGVLGLERESIAKEFNRRVRDIQVTDNSFGTLLRKILADHNYMVSDD